MKNELRHHHYVPQFYLRSFACDPERRKVGAIQKHGSRAGWGERRIKSIGYETDFYVREEGGRIISSEKAINEQIETPISSSDTWRKIIENRADALDPSDRLLLYVLVRHLEARTPHYQMIGNDVATLAADPPPSMEFSDDERGMYAALRATPSLSHEMAQLASSSVDWTLTDAESAAIRVFRFRVPIYASTTPVLVLKAPSDFRLRSAQLAGHTSHCYMLPLSPYASVSVAIGDFDGEFSNIEADDEVALGLRRQFVGHFSYFPEVRHLICDAASVIGHMEWAGYDVEQRRSTKPTFRRRASVPAYQRPATAKER